MASATPPTQIAIRSNLLRVGGPFSLSAAASVASIAPILVR